METTGFWQRTLDCAILLFLIGVLALKCADITRVICVDWGQIFTVAGILAFISVVLGAIYHVLVPDSEAPTIFSHGTPTAVSSDKTGKGGGK